MAACSSCTACGGMVVLSINESHTIQLIRPERKQPGYHSPTWMHDTILPCPLSSGVRQLRGARLVNLETSYIYRDVFERYAIPFDDLWARSERIPAGESFARVASASTAGQAHQWSPSRPSGHRGFAGSGSRRWRIGRVCP